MDNTQKSTVKTFASIILCIVGALLLINILNISYPISVVTTQKSGELSVIGEGQIDISPDTAYVDAGITVQNVRTVKEVETAINTVNNKIIEAMQQLNIPKEDIKTTNYSIFPDYNYENNANTIRGYNGTVVISIKVKDIEKASRVVEAATTAGANQINGVRFAIDKPELYREQARQKAIDNAKEQAQKLAKTLGIRLGRVSNIVESNTPGEYPPIMYAQKESMSTDTARTPLLEPGSQTITSTVTLYFEKR